METKTQNLNHIYKVNKRASNGLWGVKGIKGESELLKKAISPNDGENSPKWSNLAYELSGTPPGTRLKKEKKAMPQTVHTIEDENPDMLLA